MVESSRRDGRIAAVTLVVTAHLLVAVYHGLVHWVVPVVLTPLQVGYVLVVVAVAPLAALRDARRRRYTIAGIVLTASMVGSLVFGVAFHFVLSTPDHVHAVPSGPWHAHFEWTAIVGALVDAVGVIVGVWVGRP